MQSTTGRRATGTQKRRTVVRRAHHAIGRRTAHGLSCNRSKVITRPDAEAVYSRPRAHRAGGRKNKCRDEVALHKPREADLLYGHLDSLGEVAEIAPEKIDPAAMLGVVLDADLELNAVPLPEMQAVDIDAVGLQLVV